MPIRLPNLKFNNLGDITFDAGSKTLTMELGAAEDQQALVWDNTNSKWVSGSSGDASFKISGQGSTTGKIKIKGGLIRHNGIVYATDGGSSDVWKDTNGIGVDLEWTITGTIANTNYWLYIDTNFLSDVIVEYSSGNDTAFTAKSVISSNFYASTYSPDSNSVNLDRYIPIGYFRTGGTDNTISTTTNTYGEVIPRNIDSYATGIGSKIIDETYTTTGTKTYTHNQGRVPDIIDLKYYDGSKISPLTSETYITDITDTDIDLDLTGLTFGSGETVYLKMIWNNTIVALPKNEYESSWLISNAVTTFTHNLGVIPRSVTLIYDNNGTFEYLDIYSYLSSFTSTQLTMSWGALTLDSTHKAKIIASVFARPTGYIEGNDYVLTTYSTEYTTDVPIELTINKLTETCLKDTWSTTGSLNTARYVLAGSGTQNSALSFGGSTGSFSAVTEKFNGSTWSTTGSLNTARSNLAGSGTQNSALSFGGYTGSVSTVTEKFNGSTWSTTGNLNTARNSLAGSGTQNSALSFGGYTGSVSTVTEKFNGSTWSTTGSLNTAKSNLAGSGTQNSALSFGGSTGSNSAVTEKFNGSTWSTTGSLNTAGSDLAGSGTQNSALSFGGYTGSYSAVTEKFNGSTWSTTGNLNTARYGLAGSGTQNSALSFGGYTGSYSAVTEKFNGEILFNIKTTIINDNKKIELTQNKTYIDRNSTYIIDIIHNSYIKETELYDLEELNRNVYDNYLWTATGNLNTARSDLAGSGAQNSTLSFGGYDSSYSTVTEKFNGSTWSTTGSLNTARYVLAGSGTQNSALSFGGSTGSNSAVTEKFNGSTWSTTGNLNTARRYLAGSGTQNSALSFGGNTGSNSTVTEKFNGSTWSTTGSLNTARSSLAGSGTQNSALSFGGSTGSNSAVTEKFNGSTWSTTGSLNTARSNLAGSGTQNSALSFGGYTGSFSAVTEKFNGSTWSTTGSLNTARSSLAGSGTQNSALSFGGYTGSNSAVTEKFSNSFPQVDNLVQIFII